MAGGLSVNLTAKQARMLRKMLAGCANHPCPLSRGAGPEHVNSEVLGDLKKLKNVDKVRRKWRLYGETLVAVKYMTRKQWDACLDVAIQSAQDYL